MRTLIIGLLLSSMVSVAQNVITTPPPNMDGHPAVAVTRVLSSGGGFDTEHGTRPASDFPVVEESISLADVARIYRQEHSMTKQKIVYVNY